MTKPNLIRYRNVEFVQYMRQTLETINKQDVAELQLTGSLNTLTTVFNTMFDVFQQAQGSAITKEIQTLDEQRDKAITGIRTLAIAYGYHFEKGLATAADLVLAAIDKYGSRIARRTYNEQTGILYSIVKDFESETTLTEALTKLNLGVWFTELKTANSEFDTKFIERVEATADAPQIDFLALRKEASEAYSVLVEHIKAHKILSSKGVYEMLLDRLSELAKQYNQVISNRTTSSTDTNTEPSSEEE
ncbi:conserved hypothetical protein [Tenacibaculum sp. 190524A02b]|uniref:Uncharacterized protein n=1 Tax=Tenacibaculum vairaonense TaxID=3137860 RepID=A0ABM9PJF2_9FLAO